MVVAPEVIWLTVEGGERIGVTSEHPLFVVDAGWTRVEEVLAGDALRTASLAEVLVLKVEVESATQRVYNLEVGEAATYFVGDAEVWGHNGKISRAVCKLKNLGYEFLAGVVFGYDDSSPQKA